jgi:formate--tetrahydrofolate ligase
MKVDIPSDLEIARKAELLPMADIAARMGIGPHLLEPYGHDVSKIKLDAIDELKGRPKAKYVVVSAITPTPLGEGKSTTTVKLGDAIGPIGSQATVAIRQRSMGPTFGIKGGAAGGGYSQREVRASVGAGFIYPICGEMRTMPGLPTDPMAAHIDIDVNGNILGLS